MTGVFHVLLVIACVCLYGVQSSTRRDVQMLHDKVLQNYDRDLGPNFNQSQSIVLSISFNLYTINEFDDKNGKLVFVGISTIEWKDDRMVWDALQYGNTTEVTMPESQVWIPYLFVSKPYNNVKRIGNDIAQITYTADGSANWAVPDLFEISCTANIAYYPFDRQICEIFIIPWAYAKGTFDIRLPFDIMTQKEFIENGIWKVLSTEMREVQHVDVDFVTMVMIFQRRPLFIVLNLLLPIAVVGVLNVFVFLLPPEPGERSAFGVTVLLAMAVFLSIVSDKLPNTSAPHIARVSIYLVIELALSALIMVFTIVSLTLYNVKDDKPVPGWVKRLVPTRSKLQKDKLQDTRVRRKENTPAEHHGNRQRLHRNDRYGDSIDFNQIYRGYCAEQFRLGDHQSELDSQNYRDSPTASEDREKAAVTHPPVAWNDVAKWFDNVCLALFMFFNICIVAVKVIDTAAYMNSDVI